jgi:hypothetical protein
MRVILSGKNTMADRTFLVWKSDKVIVRRIDQSTIDKDAKQFKTLHHLLTEDLPKISELIDTATNMGVYVEIISKNLDETDPWAQLTPEEKEKCAIIQFADNKEANSTLVLACFEGSVDLLKYTDLQPGWV